MHPNHFSDLEDFIGFEDNFDSFNYKRDETLMSSIREKKEDDRNCVSMKIGHYQVQVSLLNGHKKSKINSNVIDLIPPLMICTETTMDSNLSDDSHSKIVSAKYELTFGRNSKEFTFQVQDFINDDIILGWDILNELEAQFDFGQSVVRFFANDNCSILPLMCKKFVPKLLDVVSDREIELGPDEKCVISFRCPPVPQGTTEILFDSIDETNNCCSIDALSSIVKIHKGRIPILVINSKWRQIKINEGEIIGKIRLPSKKLPQVKRCLKDGKVKKYFIKEANHSFKLSQSSIKTQNINELIESILQDQMEDLKNKRQKLQEDRKKLIQDEKSLSEKEENLHVLNNFMQTTTISNCLY